MSEIYPAFPAPSQRATELRAMRIFDGPDEVHLTSITRAELGRAPRFSF